MSHPDRNVVALSRMVKYCNKELYKSGLSYGGCFEGIFILAFDKYC